MSVDRTELLTLAALCAFASNSILCRLALGGGLLDAASFTAVRLVSGAGVLLVLSLGRAGSRSGGGSWPDGLLLFLYAAPFSFAYLALTAATGALILFASVQITMIAWGLKGGDRPASREWVGLLVALGGLLGLVSPGLRAPAPGPAALMAIAGIAWGFYSLRGRAGRNALAATRGNFLRASVPSLLLCLPFLPGLHASPRGIALAVASGGIASALGYVIWYAALQGLTPMQAALAQIGVPVLVAAAGVVFLSEALSARLLVSGAAILSGIALARMVRRRRAAPASSQV